MRVAYVLLVARNLELGADATWYLLVGGSIRDGVGFVDPETLFTTGAAIPTANFPPLYPGFLAVVQLLFGSSETVAQLAGAVVGTSTVVIVAFIARSLLDMRTSVVAALLVALSPMLIAGDGSLMSEALYVPLVSAAVLFALLAGRHGRWWAWLGLGISIGLASLTRSEALMLLVLLVAPVLWWSALELRARLLGALVAVAVTGLVIAPWVLRNDSSLGVATISTVSPATALAGANCDATYSGESLGSWEYACTCPDDRVRLGEVAWTDELRSAALDHMRDNAGRLPVVMAARELRVWGLWDPADLVARDVEETRSEWFQWVVRVTGVATLLAGAIGLWRLRDRGREVVVVLAPVVMVATTALVSHGNPRFRTVAEPMVLLGVAVLATALWDRLVQSWRT